MDGHNILLLIAILCELAGAGITFWGPERYGNSISAVAAGLLFYFISLLVK